MSSKKAIVLSGGGSRGAWSIGVLNHLIRDDNKKYDIFVGTSTGALIVPLLAANLIDQLNIAYTTAKQSSIFKFCPFIVKSNHNGQVKTRAKYVQVGWRLLVKREKTFGDSSNLKDFIRKYFTPADYETVKKEQKEVYVSVTNLTLGKIEYKSITDCTYEEFCDWMFASSCYTPFMSMFEKDNEEFVDGGVLDPIPIQKAIDAGADEIDVIILKKEDNINPVERTRNFLNVITRMLDILSNEIDNDDINIGKLEATIKDVKINLIYMPRSITNNPLVFDPEMMTKWRDEAYQYMKDECEPKTVFLKKKT